MDWLRPTGVFGDGVGGVTATLVVAAAVAARGRCTRGVAIALLVLCVLPVAVGLAGMLDGVWMVNHRVGTTQSPTAANVAAGAVASLRCLAVGLAGSGAACLVALAALLRSTKVQHPAPAR